MNNFKYLILATLLFSAVSCQRDIDETLNKDREIGIDVSINPISSVDPIDSKSSATTNGGMVFSDVKTTVLRSEDGSAEYSLTYEKKEGIGGTMDTKGVQYNWDNGLALLQSTGFKLDMYSSILGNTAELVGQTVSYDNGTGKWNLSSVAAPMWKRGETKTIFAYANTPTNTAVWTSAAGQALQMLVPGSAAEQKDILTGYFSGVPTSANHSANVTFVHPLTAVEFRLGIANVAAVTNITLSNVYNGGTLYTTYSYDASGALIPTYSWDFNGFSINGAVNQVNENGLPIDAQGKIGESFILIPEAFGANGVSIYAHIVTGTGVHQDVYGYLPAGSWAAGTTNTYVLSGTAYNYQWFGVAGDVSASYAGQDWTNNYVVYSDAPWKIQLTEDGYNWYDAIPNYAYDGWLYFNMTSGGPTAATGQPVATYVVGAQPSEVAQFATPHGLILQTTPEKGTANTPYDLSLYNISGQWRGLPVTANSYIVNGPGWYAFPIVYGNAIDYTKNGTDGNNVWAYTFNGEASSNTYLKNFMNYGGGNIDTPFIYGAASATILWEDLVNNAAIDYCDIIPAAQAAAFGLSGLGGRSDYIRFHVPITQWLDQGNATIAARDGNGTIMWSWHIWITDQDMTCRSFLSNGKGILPVNLGWVDGGSTQAGYPTRIKSIRFAQIQGSTLPNLAYKYPRRNEFVTSVSDTYGSSPTYQWGRKDPFMRTKGKTDDSELDTYSLGPGQTTPIIKNDGNNFTIPYAIQHPMSFATGTTLQNNKWTANGGKYLNLWSANASKVQNNAGAAGWNAPPVKTVYDPCPPGFEVPQGNAFNNFTKVGSWNKGYTFSTGSGENSYYPALGGRYSNNGNFGNLWSYGYYWTAIAYNHNGGRMGFYFYNGTIVKGISDAQTLHAGSAYFIRPVME